MMGLIIIALVLIATLGMIRHDTEVKDDMDRKAVVAKFAEMADKLGIHLTSFGITLQQASEALQSFSEVFAKVDLKKLAEKRRS